MNDMNQRELLTALTEDALDRYIYTKINRMLSNVIIDHVYPDIDSIPDKYFQPFNKFLQYTYNYIELPMKTQTFTSLQEQTDEYCRRLMFVCEALSEISNVMTNGTLLDNLGCYAEESFDKLDIQYPFKPTQSRTIDPNTYYVPNKKKPTFVFFWHTQKDLDNEYKSRHPIDFYTAADILIDITKFRVKNIVENVKRYNDKDPSIISAPKVTKRYKALCRVQKTIESQVMDYAIVYRVMNYCGQPIIHIIHAMLASSTETEVMNLTLNKLKNRLAKLGRNMPEVDRILYY
jgi:hypothetical protein